MSGKVYTRRGLFWIRYRAGGRDIRVSVAKMLGISPRQVTEKLARQALEAKLGEVSAGRHIPPGAMRLRVGELLDQYLGDVSLRGKPSLRKLQYAAKPLREAFGSMRACDLTTPDLRKYLRERLDAGYAAATVVGGEIAVLRAAYMMARRENRLTVVPYFPSVPLDNVRRSFVEPEQADSILAELEQPFRDAAAFSYVATRRVNEVLRIPWTWVDRQSREVRWPKTKNGQPLTLPLVDELWRIIQRRWQARTVGQWLSPWVFHVSQLGPLSYSAYRVRFLRAVTRAGFPNIRPHDFRRSGIRNMIRAGVTPAVAKSISGHISDSVFSRYNISSTKDQVQAFEQVLTYQQTRIRANEDNLRTMAHNPGEAADESLIGPELSSARSSAGERIPLLS